MDGQGDHRECDVEVRSSSSESRGRVSGEVRVERATEPKRPSGARQALSTITGHPIPAGIIAAVIAGLVLFYGFGIGDSDPSGPSGPSGATSRPTVEDSSDNAIEEVAVRSFWVAPPETFDGADEPTDQKATVELGDVRAADPKYLIENAPDWAAEGEPVYLVGKIVAGQQPSSEHGIGYETRVRGVDRGFDVWVGTDDGPIGAEGDVIYALGRVAARGETTTPSGRRVRTGYFFALDTAEVGIVYLDNHGPQIRDYAEPLTAERSDFVLPVP
jgi:hypothetical protein